MFELIDNNPAFVVINKYPDVSFHAEQGESGLVEAVKQQLDIKELYPVHRLDKITSGLLLLAKSRAVAAAIGQAFETRQVDKYYLALSDRRPKKKQGLIRGDMLKARNGSWRLGKTLSNPAQTQFFSYGLGQGMRLFLLKPLTGKTHQLRVALKSIGAPVLGDKRYYPDRSPLAPSRGYLHAWQIRFSLSLDGEKIDHCYRAPLTHGLWCEDEACGQVLATLSSPWTLPWPAVAKGS